MSKEERRESITETIADTLKNCFYLGALTDPKIDWIKLVKMMKDSFEKGRKFR